MPLQRLSLNGRPLPSGAFTLVNGDVVRVCLRVLGGASDSPAPSSTIGGSSVAGSPVPYALSSAGLSVNISESFHILSGMGDGPDDNVLETFSCDVAGGVVPSVLDLHHIVEALRKFPTPRKWPPAALAPLFASQADHFRYGPAAFGGHGITVIKAVVKGTLFCYQGPTHGAAGVNMYSLAIEANSSLIGRGSCMTAYVDGTPSATSLLGGMNDFIWDASGNNFALREMGVIEATRNIGVGEGAFMC